MNIGPGFCGPGRV